MYFLSHTLRVCYFTALLKLLDGYLLFAANLEDFHEIAKKLVPEHLADSLTKIAAAPKRDEEAEESDEVGERADNFKGKRKVNVNDKSIDFEELVERVKKRLEQELKTKFKKKDEGNETKDRSEYTDEDTDRTTKYVSDRRDDDYADALEPFNKKKRNIKEKIDRDEGEDEDNKKRFKVKHNGNAKEKSRSETEVGARTEDISFDDDDGDSKKPGTVIPKREKFSMVTPNHISPEPGEKYDFDEPLPEQDRERENLKYIGNPPAFINKKVRLV